MRVCIVGAGGIGGSLGARLAATGHEVSLVARGAHLAALREHGLCFVDHVDGYSGTYRLTATDDPGQLPAQDIIFLTLKAHAIGPMLPRLAPLLAPETVVVPAINGLPWWYFYREGGPLEGERVRALDPEGTMFAALDCARILGCVVHMAAQVPAPGEVHLTGGRRLILGEPDNSHSARLAQVCKVLEAAGFEAVASQNIRLEVWTKLLGNLSFNPVAALTGYLMNQICADASVLEVIRTTMREGMAVAAYYGYPMPITVEQRIDMARQLGAAKISMLQDLEGRKPLELDAISGAVIELAERANIAVPAIRLVHALTLARARALGIYPPAATDA
ncbi:MAG: 2-dehydropantoate 2-reductase [Sutterellaceae bacterium]|nr:2-dehydropantoate 2-reductase [Burkholderiaceae bacterium]MDW8430620.1 2-dehydropantoate 2-reductase [Sutterellaceae bacterium]